MRISDWSSDVCSSDLVDPPPGGAILAVEGCGMCGSDIKQYHGGTARAGIMSYPVIPGHETVGRIAKIDVEGVRRWGLKEGDRVAVHGIAPCGTCSGRSEEHTSELQSLMRSSVAGFCLK